MEIHLNITFPKIPCELLTLDVMDVSGEQQTGVMHGVHKFRLSAQEEGGNVLDIKALDLYVSTTYLRQSCLHFPDIARKKRPNTLDLTTAERVTVQLLLRMHKNKDAATPVKKFEKHMPRPRGLLEEEKGWSSARESIMENA